LYDIVTYETAQGKDEIAEYVSQLAEKAKTSKEHRVKLKKIFEYLDILATYGTRAGLPSMRHLDGDIWELRPFDERILYAYWENDVFILLHHFAKRTQKTPQREIEQAKRNLQDWLERKKGDNNGEL
jgi:phage-related protein